MSRLTRWVLGHKLIVVAFWLILMFVGFASVQRATSALSQQFSLPGQQAYDTNLRIVALYHTGGFDPPIVPVLTLPAGASVRSPAVDTQLARIFGGLQRLLPFARVASYANARSSVFASRDGRTTYALIYLPPAAGFGNPPGQSAVQSYLAHQSVDGARFYLSGIDLLSSGSGGGGGPGVLAEALIGGAGALIVLVLVFRSFMALIPLLMAVVTIPTTFLAVWGLTAITQVSFIIEFLVALIGLGVAIDYSLLVVIRWREEREHGASNEEAVQRSMERAGLAVVFSGTTVAIGLLALVALPVPFLQSVGYGGMLIPLVSVLVAITLLPVVLATVGPKIDWPRMTRDARTTRLWMAWGGLVVRYRLPAAAIAILVLGALLAPLSIINLGNARADALARSGPAYEGLKALEHSGIGAGALEPFEILGPQSTSAIARTKLGRVPGTLGATPVWSQNTSGGAPLAGDPPEGLFDVVPAADGSSPSGIAALHRVQSEAKVAGVTVGGTVAQGQAFISAVYGNFPLMILLIVVVTFLLLARAFRSALLPLKAVVLNIVSVGAAWGVMTLIWQQGYGSKAIWGIPATGAIESWIPVMVFAFLFGLSMDYEVFILSRVREEYDRLGSTDAAVTVGIGRTGRLVTSAALILFLAFVSLGTAPLTIVKEMATGLAVGIILDATVIRSLLVPSLVSLFGRWNWWLPAAVARPLFVAPSTPREEPARKAA